MSALFNNFGEYDREEEEKRRAELLACLNATDEEEIETEGEINAETNIRTK